MTLSMIAKFADETEAPRMNLEPVEQEPASVIAIPTIVCECCLRPLTVNDGLVPGAQTIVLYCATRTCVLEGLLLEIPLMRMRARRIGSKSALLTPV